MSDILAVDHEHESVDPIRPESDASQQHVHSSHQSSPAHHERTYWRRKGQQLSNWWSSLKKFAPQRLARSRSKERKPARKKDLQDTARLSSSHPDVSHPSLAEFMDSMDAGTHSASASLTSSPKKTVDATPTPLRSPFLGKRLSIGGVSLFGTDSSGRQAEEPAGGQTRLQENLPHLDEGLKDTTVRSLEFKFETFYGCFIVRWSTSLVISEVLSLALIKRRITRLDISVR